MSKQIIAVVNQKGGVGKTTTVINLSACVATLGHKVLIVDLDPQGNSTSGLGLAKDTKATIYELMLGTVQVEKVIQKTSITNLDIIPANQSLSGFEADSQKITSREELLKDKLSNLDYDYIFIDCPPSLGSLTVNALNAAKSILITVQTEYYAMEGLSQLLNTIQIVQQHLNPEIIINGVVLTMYDKRTSLSVQVKNEIEQFFKDLVYDTNIPRNVRLAEAPSFGKTIFQHEPWSRGAKAYKSLAKEFIRRTT